MQIQITISDENGTTERVTTVGGAKGDGPGTSSTAQVRPGSGTLGDLSAGTAPAEPGDSSAAPLAGTGPLVGIDAGPAPAPLRG